MMPDILSADLWTPGKHWSRLFPRRTNMQAELLLLDRLFPLNWRRETFGGGQRRPPQHLLPNELCTVPGRTRLLDLAAALLHEGAAPLSSGPDAPWRIPMQGRLRCWSLYEPTLSEFLVGPLLRPVGEVTWQPPGEGPRADYVVRHEAGALVAEVKRLRVSQRFEKLRQRRDAEFVARLGAGSQGPTQSFWSEEERRVCTQADIPRLYRRVTHAAKQLDASSARARRFASDIRGVLFLDVHENPYLLNVLAALRGWMQLRWARPIDLIMCFYYASHDVTTGTVAQAVYSRTGAALRTLFLAHLPRNRCKERGHIHLAGVPRGGCVIPFGV